MQYQDVVNALAALMVISPTDFNFNQAVTLAITDAEQRIYRELDLVSNSTRNTTYAVTAGSRNVVMPVGTFVEVNGVNIITPAGTANPELGARSPCIATSWSSLDAIYGSNTVLTVPKYYALQDSSTLAFGPWPDQSYQLEILGNLRPAQLSASNPTDFLSTQLPDLLVAACMVFMAGYAQNYGQQSDDPTMALSWENHYQALLKSAQTEEARKHAMSSMM